MNLDEFEPMYIEHAASKLFDATNPAYKRSWVSSTKKRVARIIKKLRDWRTLETLFIDVKLKAGKRSKEYWSFVHEVDDAAKAAGCEFCVVKGDYHDSYIMIENHSTRSSLNLQYFIDWGMRNPTKKFYTLTDLQVAEFHRLYWMTRKWSRRLEKVRSYMYAAMEARLRSWFESIQGDTRYAAMRDVRLEEFAKFNIVVDDRSYAGVITSYGSVKWVQWDLMEVTFT